MVIFLQRTFTSLIHVYVERTQACQPDSFLLRPFAHFTSPHSIAKALHKKLPVKWVLAVSPNHREYMSLTEKQIGILKGMLLGAFIALCIVGLGSYLNPFGYQESLNTIEKLKVAFLSSIIPTVFLAASIGRLARHRFFTPEDIDGGGLSNGSAQATLLQSLLQNTFEQTLLASLVYCAWSVVMPATSLSVVPIAAISFGLGRILFFTGYKKGAPSRAIGFTLSFYPSIIMLGAIIGTLLWQ